VKRSIHPRQCQTGNRKSDVEEVIVISHRDRETYQVVKKLYSEKVMEHFKCPQNVGSMLDANGEGSVGDPNCGDSLTIYVKVQDEIIIDISFLVFGCTASIATSSMTTVLAKGKSLRAALEITEQDIIDSLGGLPKEKQHCSNLGVSALHKAIHNYRDREKQGISNSHSDNEFSLNFTVKTVRV